MSQTHQKMVALHRIPVVRKAMLVLVPLAFLHQEVALDPPTMSRPEIAALMHVLPAEGFARQPGMFGMLVDNLRRLRIHLFPALRADYYVYDLLLSMVIAVVVFDVVDPPEVLP